MVCCVRRARENRPGCARTQPSIGCVLCYSWYTLPPIYNTRDRSSLSQKLRLRSDESMSCLDLKSGNRTLRERIMSCSYVCARKVIITSRPMSKENQPRPRPEAPSRSSPINSIEIAGKVCMRAPPKRHSTFIWDGAGGESSVEDHIDVDANAATLL